MDDFAVAGSIARWIQLWATASVKPSNNVLIARTSDAEWHSR